MNSKAVNTLNYTGIVTLSQYVGNNKVQLAQIHNTGGTSLFNFLASCLAGHFQYASVNWPTKIKLLDYAVDGSEYTYESVSVHADNVLGLAIVRYGSYPKYHHQL